MVGAALFLLGFFDFLPHLPDFLLRLGILSIALPLISAALSCLIFGAFDVEVPGDYGNGSAIIVGIVLILSSLVFSYGAELEGAKA